ncbi:ATPK1 [Symbiodinium pilosum]|uniref:ATPK1 protein n=1 Tax=Symbiodinium pilosum TaxID=2952 RepID=A0A812W0F2_SYMPI|nr:ATPK1 [Symbiodinium pilosum]
MLLLCTRMSTLKAELLRHLSFVMLHITDYLTNILTMVIVCLVDHPRYFYVLLLSHLIIGCFCTYTASTRLDWKRWCCVPFINFFLMVICMGLMQGVQLYMAHEDYMKRRARSLDVESNLSELRVPAMMPARFHSKAMDGLLEGSVFAYVSMYALIKDRWAEPQFNPVQLEETWYTPCLYIGAFCSIINVGLALVEIDHRTSACVQNVLDETAIASSRHLAFRAAEFSMRLLTMLAFCTFMRPLHFWWIAYVLVAADYLFGVALLVILGGRDPVREASVVLGVPLFMVNIMQFVDAPGMSLQARQISEIMFPLRTAELIGVLLFCVLCPAQIKVVGEHEELSMLHFILRLHPSWAVCWAASVVIYYLLFATYAARTKPGADLHSAVAYGEVEVLRRLLRSSELVLDISRFGPDGRNPLHLAARRGQVECMKLLVEEKADLQARTGNKQQHMALHLAAMNKAPDAARFLCQVCRGDPQLQNAGNADGDTPLHIAARFQNVEVLRELLRHPGVDVRSLNKQGLAPAECAPSDKFSFDHDSAECAIADMLRAAEARSRQAPRNGETVSSEAARSSAVSKEDSLELSDLNLNPRASSSNAPAAEQVVPPEDDPRQPSSQNVPLVSVGREAEENFLRTHQGAGMPQQSVDAPLAVTNCGLSSFMLSAGLGAVSRFFLGSIAEDSDKGFNGSEATTVSIEDFAEMRMLGEGAFGKVVLVRHKETGELYAMKTMDKAKFKAQKITSKAQSEQFILRTTRHPFIVQLHFAFQCSYFWALVMDFCPNGDLQGCLAKYGVPGLRLEDAARFAGEVLLALEHLHSIRVIFRDLKLENVVIDSNFRAKVTDFGLAKKLYAGSDANTMCGSYGYAAPEIMLNTGRYTYAVDLYSYGVMLYMLVSGGETSQRNPMQKTRLPPKTHGQLKKKLRDSEKDVALLWARPASAVLPLLKMLTSENPLERTNSTTLKSNTFFVKHLPGPVEALLEERKYSPPQQ